MKNNTLTTLIEPHLHGAIKKASPVNKINAIDLLTHTRFDLAFKLFYLSMRDKNKVLARIIYAEHIRAFSLNTFTEPGNKKKNGLKKFLNKFNDIFNSIKKDGFDPQKTVIPLSCTGAIVNGSHRVASAIYLNKSVHGIALDIGVAQYDYTFFRDRGVSEEVLDLAAIEFIQQSKNIYIAFIWPVKKEKQVKIETVLPNIVYKKKIKLNQNGAHNILSQVYAGEEWTGAAQNNFAGIQAKLVKTFETFDSFEVVAFQETDLKTVLKLKEKIRKVFNVGKHSIHITDTREEAKRLAQVIFNNNSLHFLNFANPTKYKDAYHKINEIKQFLITNNIDKDTCVIDGGSILSLYGLREAHDIDYIAMDDIEHNNPNFESHDKELGNHAVLKDELIFNPKYHFYFDTIKFISFNQLYMMKKNRGESKDQNDCHLMEGMVNDDKVMVLLHKVQQHILYTKLKIKITIVELLQKVGLYESVHSLYAYIKR